MTKKLATIIDIVFYSIIILLSYLIIKYVLLYILPFLISFLLIFLLQKPSIKIANKIKVQKNIITISMLIILIFTIGAIISLISIKLFKGFINNSSGFSNILNTFFSNDINLPNEFKNFIYNYFYNFSANIISWGSSLILSTTTKVIKVLPSFLISVVISLVSSCYLAFYYDQFTIFIKKQLSKPTIEKVVKLKNLINSCFIKMIVGYFTIFLVTFLELLFGFWVLNVKHSLILAIIVSFVDILPVLGTGIVLIPYAIFNIISNNFLVGIGLIVLYVIITIMRYFLEPKIIGNKVGINPIISLILIFLGLKLFGVFGIIILPLIASIISILNKEGIITLYK